MPGQRAGGLYKKLHPIRQTDFVEAIPSLEVRDEMGIYASPAKLQKFEVAKILQFKRKPS